MGSIAAAPRCSFPWRNHLKMSGTRQLRRKKPRHEFLLVTVDNVCNIFWQVAVGISALGDGSAPKTPKMTERLPAPAAALDNLGRTTTCTLHTTMTTPPTRDALLHLYSSTLRTSRAFSSYNFRNYFLRRTKDTFREIQVRLRRDLERS